MSESAAGRSVGGKARTWFVRAGSAGSAARAFLDEGFVGLGWSETGSLSSVSELRAIEVRLVDAFPRKSRRTITAWAAMLRSICSVMAKGDAVMTIEPERRQYWIGKIMSDYRWVEGATIPHRRQVTWRGSLERASLSEKTLRCLGAISTVFRLSPAATEEVDSQFRRLGVPRASGQRPKDPSHG